MQSSNEYVCMDCGSICDYASDLLKHFAHHVKIEDANFFLAENSKQNKKTSIPDLYPISIFRELHNSGSVDIKIEGEDLNPSSYCEITLGKVDNVHDSCEERPVMPKMEINDQVRSPVCDYHVKETLKKHYLSQKPHLKRKQQKCSIKRKCTKFEVQSSVNSLLCST